MYLCIDVGNSQIHCGIFSATAKLLLQFRYNTSHVGSSDQFAIFVLQVLRENGIDPTLVRKVAIASVVPSVDYSLSAAFVKYFKITPMFVQPGVKTGIKISSNNASEIGADLIAGAVGGLHLYPERPLLIFDFGTATTVIYVTADSEFVGGAVLPGIRLMMESLERNTAKLFNVSISKPRQVIAKDTRMAIQSGLYYSQVGAVRELVDQITTDYKIKRSELVVIGTGGFANLLSKSNAFDKIIPDLLLQGLYQIIKLNEEN